MKAICLSEKRPFNKFTLDGATRRVFVNAPWRGKKRKANFFDGIELILDNRKDGGVSVIFGTVHFVPS